MRGSLITSLEWWKMSSLLPLIGDGKGLSLSNFEHSKWSNRKGFSDYLLMMRKFAFFCQQKPPTMIMGWKGTVWYSPEGMADCP